jgi:O-antigen/teichoic acid export membrane protein
MVDKFVKNYIIYFTGSMLVAFCNYLLYPILGRLLDVASFGEVQSLVAMLGQVAILFGVFSTVTVHIIASAGDHDEKAAIIAVLRRIVRWGVLVVGGLIILVSPFLTHFFRFKSSMPFWGLALALMATTLPLFYNAYLQGAHRFGRVSITSLVVATGRIVVGFGLIVLGWDVFGVMAGIAIAQVIAWLSVRSIAAHTPELSDSAKKPTSDASGRLKRELRYAGSVLLVNGALALLCTADVLVMKHYFAPDIAGLYAGISAVGNIIFFAISPISGVLLPSVAAGPEKRHKTLIMALGVWASIGAAGLLIFYSFHDIIVKVLMGSRFATLASLLPWVAAYMLGVSLTNILAVYFLALRKGAVAFILPLGVVLTGFLAVIHHLTVYSVVINFVVGAWLTALALVILYAKDHLHYRSGLQRSD